MTRLSLTEQYNNKDVLTQLYRVIDIVEHGSIQTVTSTKEGDDVIVSFTMHDGTVHTITFPANGISSIVSRQDGSTMYVDITLNDGTVQTISWTIVPGVTLDTAQTITGAKTFSALGTFLLGIAVTGMSTIDGDLQITNGHNLSVAGDIDAAGALKGDSAEIRGPMSVSGQSEIAGMAIEPNGDATAISNDNGISSDSPLTLTGLVTATNIPTTPTGVRDTKPVNGTRLQNDLDAYEPMMRLVNNQTVDGIKVFEFEPEGVKFASIVSDVWVEALRIPYDLAMESVDWVVTGDIVFIGGGTYSPFIMIYRTNGTRNVDIKTYSATISASIRGTQNISDNSVSLWVKATRIRVDAKSLYRGNNTVYQKISRIQKGTLTRTDDEMVVGSEFSVVSTGGIME